MPPANNSASAGGAGAAANTGAAPHHHQRKNSSNQEARFNLLQNLQKMINDEQIYPPPPPPPPPPPSASSQPASSSGKQNPSIQAPPPPPPAGTTTTTAQGTTTATITPNGPPPTIQQLAPGQTVVSVTAGCLAPQNTTITAQPDQSYDYFMEAANNNRSINNTMDGGQISRISGNDTFEEIWRDELDEDLTAIDGDVETEDDGTLESTETDEQSRLSLSLQSRRLNWKANHAAHAVAMAQQQQQQQQQHNIHLMTISPPVAATSTTTTTMVGDFSSNIPVIDSGTTATNNITPGKQQEPPAGGSSNSSITGTPTSQWFSPASAPGSGFTNDTHAPLPRNGGTALVDDQSTATGGGISTTTGLGTPSSPSPHQGQISANHRNNNNGGGPPTPQRIVLPPSSATKYSSPLVQSSERSLNSETENSLSSRAGIYASSMNSSTNRRSNGNRHSRRRNRPPLPLRERSDNNHHATVTPSVSSTKQIGTAARTPLSSSSAASTSAIFRNYHHNNAEGESIEVVHQQKLNTSNNWKQNYQVVKRSKSSPPDPPSHLVIPKQQNQIRRGPNTPSSSCVSPVQQRVVNNSAVQLSPAAPPPSSSSSKQRRVSPPSIPEASGSDYCYDPDDADGDDDDDALTNLVITVMGLDGNEEEQQPIHHHTNRRHHHQQQRRSSNSNNKLIRHTVHTLDDQDQDEASLSRTHGSSTTRAVAGPGDIDRSHLSAGGGGGCNNNNINTSSSVVSSFETLFLSADSTSGIFFTTLLLLFVPIILLTMMLWDCVDVENVNGGPNVNDAGDQISRISSSSAGGSSSSSSSSSESRSRTIIILEEWRSVLNIPMNEDISIAVRVTQICFLLGWVLLVKQTTLVQTTLQFLDLLTTRRRRGSNKQGQYYSDGSGHDQLRRGGRRSTSMNGRERYANIGHPTTGTSRAADGAVGILSPTAAVSGNHHDGGSGISKGRWMVGTLLEWFKHVLYMVNAVVVLLQATDSVMMLVWNMAGLEFVSRLDSLAFHAWVMGKHHFLVKPNQSPTATTSHIVTTPITTDTGSAGNPRSQEGISMMPAYQFPNPPMRRPMLRVILYSLISCAILLAYGVIVYEQVLGHPPVQNCQAIALQFGEVVQSSVSPSTHYYYASLFGGIYQRRQGQFRRHHGRYIYELLAPWKHTDQRYDEAARTRKSVSSFKLAYCRPLQAWTLSRGREDPCEAYMLRTAPTKSYDPLALQGDGIAWFVTSSRDTLPDVQLDWFRAACVDCGSPNELKTTAFGYHCMNNEEHSNIASIQDYHDQANALHDVEEHSPCTNITWDTRREPFPDILWQLPEFASNHEDMTAPIQYYDDGSATIDAGVDPLAPFEVMVDASGSVLLEPQFQRPVYASHYNSQLVLLIFLGRRWVIVLMRSPRDTISEWRAHPERHLERLHSLWAHLWEEQLLLGGDFERPATKSHKVVPMFVSEPVDMSMDKAAQNSPIGINWNQLEHDGRQSTLASKLVVGNSFDTILHCAVCKDESNPCHSGGFCHIDGPNSGAGGHCVCRPGFIGFLCESFTPRCQGDLASDCLHQGTCTSDGMCDCPMWKRNNKALPVRGDICEYLPNCWDFENDGLECFEKGTCSNHGCDNGGICTMDGTCDCEAQVGSTRADTGKYRGKLCQEQVNCYDFEADGRDCIERGTCTSIACNGGTCSTDGSCSKCPKLATGRFCQVLPDCFDYEIDGRYSNCFDLGRCTNLGCTNGGQCQKDGSCRCPSEEEFMSQAEEESLDPFDDQVLAEDDDTLIPVSPDDGIRGVMFSGKLCQISSHQAGSGSTDLVPLKPNSEPSNNECILSSCVMNGGFCSPEGLCVCPEGLSGYECEIGADCFETEIDGRDCFHQGTCKSTACHSRSNNSTCRADGNCECPEMNDVELYGKLCNKVWPIDDCFEAEADGRDCFKLGTCSNVGCDNGGRCTPDGTCDCSFFFWGKRCQHASDCFEQEYSCYFNTFLTGGGGAPLSAINPTNSPCSDAGCMNNGICQTSGTCLCPEGYAGKVCQDKWIP